MSRPITATINTAALKKNLSIVRNIAPRSHIWAVIKANAYGHGIERVWKSLSNTDGFALLDIHEALLLREQGWQKPILLLEGFFHSDDLNILHQYHLTTIVHSHWQIQALKKAYLPSPLDIYLKINCGMNRLGFQPSEIHKIWHQLKELRSVGKLTLMTHFAEAECTQEVIEYMKKFSQTSKNLNGNISVANSAAILWHPQTHFDWVRPGIILYGASPSKHWKDIEDSGLVPVMTLNSKIIAIQNLVSGSSVGYSHYYRASHMQYIGIVACGYADGYPHHAPTGTPVMVEGIVTQTIGAISMDMIAVDLTRCPQARIGSSVELWGENIKINDVASISGTIGYELMCALSSRVPVKIK
ncbi:catabolic alanine racemase DadX [Candidatus Erwinia haradaeae]|uniref:Alanine racemase n=1 Tax=Candidatus Erwinia haradaeae TaxID=1922217 RepID=A0A451D1P0_9GAMM|nr:catabolic alanine racemase DadX [Candidatus Erwinia haradaeae]VFP79528.1 Alanine racemase, catabolic [Candidatus Erwinia haradaeae]